MRDPRIARGVRESRQRLAIFERDTWDIHVTIDERLPTTIYVTAWNRRVHRPLAFKERTAELRQKKALDELARLTQEMGGYDNEEIP